MKFKAELFGVPSPAHQIEAKVRGATRAAIRKHGRRAEGGVLVTLSPKGRCEYLKTVDRFRLRSADDLEPKQICGARAVLVKDQGDPFEVWVKADLA